MSFLKKIVARIAHRVSAEIEPIVAKARESQRQQLEELAILQGRTLALQNGERAPLPSLHDAEFKVFSQFGEDGILQYLIRETKISRKETTFIEFGVQDYLESNTRFLLMSENWRGMIIDGSQHYMDQVRGQKFFWRNDLTAVTAWINRDNINQLITNAGFAGDLGVLSIDIDGNDYWVWESITAVNPVIVVVEWNSVFGPTHPVTIPYAHDFERAKAHHSCLYWGASISALAHLGEQKGYSLVGSNSAGGNLFFVRNDRLGRLGRVRPAEAYVESRFRESRNRDGRLTFLGGSARKEIIADLPVIQVLNGKQTTLRILDESQKTL